MKLTMCVATLALAGGVAIAMAKPGPTEPVMLPNAMEAVTYKVDAGHSAILYKVRHLGVSNHYGRFNDFGGTYTFDPADPSSASFDVSVKAGSIDSGHEGRDAHLRRADFFSAEEHMTISFKSTSVAAKQGDMYEMTGDLTLLGKTKSITVPLQWFGAKDAGPRAGFVSGFECIFTIKRSEFGMNYGVEQGGLGDEVTIIVSIEGKKQ